MTSRERFHALMAFEPVDRLPLYYFGTWPETKVRWRQEGLVFPARQGGSGGPQLAEMDPDWEMSPDAAGDIWNNQGLLDPWPRTSQPSEVIAEDAETRTIRTPLGGIVQTGRHGSSIPHTIEPDLKPTREA